MKIPRLSIALLLLAAVGRAEPVSFRQAIELAVQRSKLASATDQIRAHQAYLEASRMYVPQVIAGSGLAKTFGFPLTIEGAAPSVVNVNATGYLINPAQRDIVRAARTELNASGFSADDKRQQAILDTAETYIQLDRMHTALNLIQQQEQ
jgi:outer membrane protein TolC